MLLPEHSYVLIISPHCGPRQGRAEINRALLTSCWPLAVQRDFNIHGVDYPSDPELLSALDERGDCVALRAYVRQLLVPERLPSRGSRHAGACKRKRNEGGAEAPCPLQPQQPQRPVVQPGQPQQGPSQPLGKQEPPVAPPAAPVAVASAPLAAATQPASVQSLQQLVDLATVDGPQQMVRATVAVLEGCHLPHTTIQVGSCACGAAVAGVLLATDNQ